MTKICFYCGSHRTIKKGKDNGYQRWFCKDCKRYFMGRLRLKKEDVNSAYSLGNLTVSDLAREFGVSTRTIHRYLSSEYTRVWDKKRLEKVGNLVKNSYLYR